MVNNLRLNVFFPFKKLELKISFRFSFLSFKVDTNVDLNRFIFFQTFRDVVFQELFIYVLIKVRFEKFPQLGNNGPFVILGEFF